MIDSLVCARCLAETPQMSSNSETVMVDRGQGIRQTNDIGMFFVYPTSYIFINIYLKMRSGFFMVF